MENWTWVRQVSPKKNNNKKPKTKQKNNRTDGYAKLLKGNFLNIKENLKLHVECHTRFLDNLNRLTNIET